MKSKKSGEVGEGGGTSMLRRDVVQLMTHLVASHYNVQQETETKGGARPRTPSNHGARESRSRVRVHEVSHWDAEAHKPPPPPLRRMPWASIE